MILEVGCGTGSSTVALAEQGARVTGIDIDEDALQVARTRCEAFGLDCEFVSGNIAEYTLDRHFDFVIFFACLEHMTIEERLASLRNIWQQMPSGAHLVVLDTPNRLWWFDGHTARLPFFHWLPDELAFHYLQKSSRKDMATAFSELTPESMLEFQRRGRGVSFHEFELAIGDVRNLDVASSLRKFRKLGWVRKPRDGLYKTALKRVRPDIDDAWLEPGLNLAIRKR